MGNAPSALTARFCDDSDLIIVELRTLHWPAIDMATAVHRGNLRVLQAHLFSGYRIFEMLFPHFKQNSTLKLLYLSGTVVQRFKSAAPRNEHL